MASGAGSAALNTSWTQTLIAAGLSSVLTALVIYTSQSLSTPQPSSRPTRHPKRPSESSSLPKIVVHDETLIEEQLTRNISFLGIEGNQSVRKAFVVVVGLGGVGSAAALSLVRSGVGRIRLIDFDQVTLSSLNRHSIATRSDVGKPKVEACKTFFEKIAPWIIIDSQIEQFTIKDASKLLNGNPDWVLDCIDNIVTKVDLLTYCKKNQIKVFSALGAASKSDPSRVQIGDLSLTFEDPLARSVRRRLRLNGVTDGLPVVYSTEKPNERVTLLPLPEEEFKKGNVGELSALADFRVRILPVLGPLPSIFGQAMAAHVITQLAGFPTQPLPVKNRTKVYHRMFNDLLAREFRLVGATTIPFSDEDIGYIFEEIYRGRSVVHPTFTVTSHPCLLRWDPREALHWQNCVVMDRSEAETHEKDVLKEKIDPTSYWGKETVKLVQERFREEMEMRRWR